MLTPSFTDYLPGRVYRPDRAGAIRDSIDNLAVEATGTIDGCPYMLEVECALGVAEPKQNMLGGSIVVTAGLGAFHSNDPRPPACTPALASAWVHLSYLTLPLAIWHVTPALENALCLPQSRNREYHKPISYEDLERFPVTAGWTPIESEHWATRSYGREISVPVSEAKASPLEHVLDELPPLFGAQPRLWRTSLQYGSPEDGSCVGLTLCDHTKDCLRTLDYAHRTVLTLRHGIDGGARWPIKDIANHLQVPTGRIPRLEREALNDLRREAASYAKRPYP